MKQSNLGKSLDPTLYSILMYLPSLSFQCLTNLDFQAHPFQWPWICPRQGGGGFSSTKCSTPWPTVFCCCLIRVLTPSLSSAGTSGYGFPLPSLSVFLPIFLLSYYFNGLLFILEIPLPDKCYIHCSAFKPRSSVIFPVRTKQPFSASNFDIYNILTTFKNEGS